MTEDTPPTHQHPLQRPRKVKADLQALGIPSELKGFVDVQGRLTAYPARNRRAAQKAAIAYLASKFETGREYNERQVTDLLKQWHTFEDWATLRRELFEQGYINRAKDGTVYWATPETKIY